MPRNNVITMPNRRATYVQRIKAAMGKSVEGIIEAGKALAEAKNSLEHGEWIPMLQEDLHMSQRTAHMLMEIAQHNVISNQQHIADLPPSWGTLYELTRVPERTLNARLRDGTINPQMQRREVAALMPANRGGGTRQAPTRQRAQPVDEPQPDPDDTPEDIWRRGLRNRAEEASGLALYEDWSRFTVDTITLNKVKQAVEAWTALHTYLEELYNANR